MTIVADGKPCVCGNLGCWEQYAAAVPLYLGGFETRNDETDLRFLDIVKKAESGEAEAIRVVENIGKYLGIGIANVFTGIGIPRMIIT